MEKFKDTIINANTILKAQKEQAQTVELKFYRDIKNMADKWEYRNLTYNQMIELAKSALMQVSKL